MVDHLVVAIRVRLFVSDIGAVTADEADAKHDAGHAYLLVRKDGGTGFDPHQDSPSSLQ